jgi:hypothetical protein
MADLNTQISQVAGQPASVRIGVVSGVSPFTVSVQGAVFNDVGFVGGYFPVVGDVVALLGQSSQAGSDPTSWLCLGTAGSSPSRLLQAGQEVFTFVALTSTFADVVFAQPFPADPAVTCTIGSNAGTTSGWFVRAGLVTPTGFRLSINGPSSSWTNERVFWHATDMTQ